MLEDKRLLKKWILLAILVVVAIFSATTVTKYSTSVKTHAEAIKVLDEKKVKAMQMTATAAVTSTAISALPGDLGAPIATQISQLTTPLLLITSAIYLEKYLLTVIGYFSFRFLIPVACMLMGIYLFTEKDILRNIAIKLGIFGLVISMVIPVSMKITTIIEKTFEDSIELTYQSIEEMEQTAKEESKGTKGLKGWIEGFTKEVEVKIEKIKGSLGAFVDGIAVLLITTCVIPIGVFLFFVWFTKLMFGININVPKLPKKMNPLK